MTQSPHQSVNALKILTLVAAALAVTSTAAYARCPTLTGYPEFKRCFLEADSLADDAQARLQFETMLAEDLAKARTAQGRRASFPLDPLQLGAPVRPLKEETGSLERTPDSHRNIEDELRQQQWLRQQNNAQAARSRNNFRVEQGRARSQNLLYGQSN